MSQSQSNEPVLSTLPTVQTIDAWLDYKLAEDAQQRTRVLERLNELIDETAVITSEEQMGTLGENRLIAEALQRAVEADRVARKAPYLERSQLIDKRHYDIIRSIDPTLAIVRRMMDTFQERKIAKARREAREAAEKARAEAERLAQQAARIASASRVPERAAQAIQQAADAAAEADRKQARAEAKPAELARAKGPLGGTISARTRWDFKVVNRELVPDRLKIISSALVREEMGDRDSSGRPTAEIPGIEWVQVTTSTMHG